MLGCCDRQQIVIKWNFMIFYCVTTNVLIHGMRFIEHSTGFNINLNSFEMETLQSKSRLACGVLCEEMECASFLYEDTSKQCRIYSVFITSDTTDPIGRYYRRADVEEYTLIVTTCSTQALPSQDTNIALHKPVILSSTYSAGTGALMTDGNPSSTFPCAHTGFQQYPEALIDLGQTFAISAMYIVNRLDCCAERLHDVIIQVGDGLADLTTVFNHTGVVGADCKIIFNPYHQGRYVKLFIDGSEYLTVCELEVYSSG